MVKISLLWFKLDDTDLAANGPIVDADGSSRQEPVDPQSTVRTALIEAELERETGQVVRLGTVASAEVQNLHYKCCIVPIMAQMQL